MIFNSRFHCPYKCVSSSFTVNSVVFLTHAHESSVACAYLYKSGVSHFLKY